MLNNRWVGLAVYRVPGAWVIYLRLWSQAKTPDREWTWKIAA
jgi:hypothetical protein